MENGQANQTGKVAYTVGYGGMSSPQKLVEIMSANRIIKLVDVRSKPGTNTKFGKNVLEKLLGDLYESRTILGGFDHEVDEFEAWKARGEESIGEVMETMENGPVLIMCAEKKKEDCHRSYFMGRALEEMGVRVVHL